MKLALDETPVIYVSAELKSDTHLNTDSLRQILDNHDGVEECVIFNLKEEIAWRIDFGVYTEYPHIRFRIEDNMFRDWDHLPDNVVHIKHPFYFLYRTMRRGIEYGTRHNEQTNFCFLNNLPRPYRNKLWDKLAEDNLINEYCSFLSRRVFTKAEGEPIIANKWAVGAFGAESEPPKFYDKVAADVFVETETETLRYTEKTWKPLFHEKICLGFGGEGYYTHLKQLGFELHNDLIDYSFDTIADSDERFEMYYQQVKKVITYPLKELLNKTKKQREANRKNCMRLLLEVATIPNLPLTEEETFFSLCKTESWEILNLGYIQRTKERAL